ncbi:MAG: DUF692 domain-containing protein [Myxococcota bacterium]|nr:DUF692 domain-containing protein [Myxococcota bacterium]MDW8362397.1 DUF692 domain-containing protein [Myxococcales bacterium]
MSHVEGIGLGLRIEIAERTLSEPPAALRFVEIHPENYMRRGGRFRSVLERALDRFPVLSHGLTMGFGSSDPFDRDYLADLRELLRRIGAPWHSDHACFASADGVFAHDLLPLPWCERTLQTMTRRFEEARDALGVPLAVENVSYYAPSDRDETSEVEFLVALLERTDGLLLLDVNNVYVNARNFGFDARAFLDRIPAGRIVQLHVAGHLVRDDGLRIDTHGEAVCDDVYALLEHVLRRIGPRPVLLERDQSFPSWEALCAEIERLDAIYRRAVAHWQACQEAAQ